MVPYPAVLLGVPLWGEAGEWLVPLTAVGKLEKAGEGASILHCVREDCILEVHAMREDAVVLIHP